MPKIPLPDSTRRQEEKEFRRLSRRATIAFFLGVAILVLLVLAYLYA